MVNQMSRQRTLIWFVTLGVVLTLGLSLWLGCVTGLHTRVADNSRCYIPERTGQSAEGCIQTAHLLAIDKQNTPTARLTAFQPPIELSPAVDCSHSLTTARFESPY